MALLSYNLIEEILDVAETYATKERARLSSLKAAGATKASPVKRKTKGASAAKPSKA